MVEVKYVNVPSPTSDIKTHCSDVMPIRGFCPTLMALNREQLSAFVVTWAREATSLALNHAAQAGDRHTPDSNPNIPLSSIDDIFSSAYAENNKLVSSQTGLALQSGLQTVTCLTIK